MVSQKEDFPAFDMLFDCFWREMSYERVPMETMEIEGTPSESPAPEGGDEEGGLEEATAETLAKENLPLENLDEFSVPTYSPQELMNRKDFSEMGVEESRAVARAILLIATKIATQISRRKKIGRKGNTVDPRWTMRRSMKYGGEIVELVHRKRRIKKTKVVLLCDVSGSMDCYSRFLIQFMYGLQNELWGVETFVFSTSLSRITHLDSYQGHRQRAGKDLRQHSRLVRRHQHRPLAAHFQSRLCAEHGDAPDRRRDHQRRLGPRRCELARTRDARSEAALQENYLAQSAFGERELRAAVQRHASSVALSRFVFVRAQRQ